VGAGVVSNREIPAGLDDGVQDAIDETTLKSVFGDDDDTFRAILSDFARSSAGILQEIRKGWDNGSPEAVKQAAHKLKSSARSVGANGLANICQALEKAGADRDHNQIKSTLPDLEKSMSNVTAWIDSVMLTDSR